jgi:hypothetical protein
MSLGTGIALALGVVVTWLALATVLGVVLGRVLRRRDEQRPVERDRDRQTAEDSKRPKTLQLVRNEALPQGHRRRSRRRQEGLPRR